MARSGEVGPFRDFDALKIAPAHDIVAGFVLERRLALSAIEWVCSSRRAIQKGSQPWPASSVPIAQLRDSGP